MLYRYFLINVNWSKYLNLDVSLKNAAPVYQFAIEKDDKELIGIFKQNLIDLNQETSQKLQKILCQCNFFETERLNSDLAVIIEDYVDPMTIALRCK